MKRKQPQASIARRRFLTRLGTGGVLIGASALHSGAAATKAAGDAPWKPARHIQDDWLDLIPGKHRFLFDTTSADGMYWGLRFASNYFSANQAEYGLQQSDLAVVIVARHKSAPFGYNNAMWAKYGNYLSAHAEFTGPKGQQPPLINPYAAADRASAEPGALDPLINKGAHFAVCAMSTRAIAGKIATGTGARADAVFKELSENLVMNAHLVSAGIVAVNRAQERGYSFVTAS